MVMTGLMGINVIVHPPNKVFKNGSYINYQIKTMPHLTEKTKWAVMSNIPVRDNMISVKHIGDNETIFTNQKGPQLIWKAVFPGSYNYIKINGTLKKARITKKILGNTESEVYVTVGAGDTIKAIAINK